VTEIIRTMRWPEDGAADDALLTREWLVTNGLGGYASGTILGVPTRRFHGLLVAALPSPLGRTMMLNHLAEEVSVGGGGWAQISGEERAAEQPDLECAAYLKEFTLEAGLPVWHYEVGGARLEKRLVVPHLQNTAHVTYRLVSGPGPVRLRLRPSLHFRAHEGPVGEAPRPYRLVIDEVRYEICAAPNLPPLRLLLDGAAAQFTLDGGLVKDVFYRVEAWRGYDSKGTLWSPGYFTVELTPERAATLVASTEQWPTVLALKPDEALQAERERRSRLLALAPPQAQEGAAAELVLAADQFIITPAGRAEEAARAHAAGDEVRTVIAGYHWFTDWGRDTMISLEGLTLTTGRHAEAGWILRTFAHYVRDGLIPNMFPEGENQGLYHTADATLWFFHALDRYLRATNDRETLRLILPTLESIVEHHLKGTRFGIGVDEKDGLLRQGAEGYQLTWMDAKCDGWVVTPRRGKAVEINALWHNALRLMEGWLNEEGREADAGRLAEHARRAARSFNQRFWYEAGGYLYDVVDGEQGDDAALRPNQLLAISLAHPVLDRARWESVLKVTREQLLTPVGLRSLAPGHADYKPKYYGDLRSRDAAYHQGTVWGWLIGPFVDAYLKLYPDDRARAREFLTGFVPHLGEACVGSVSEIFDAEAPYTPRGCVAQAWSVAEALRCWVKTEVGSRKSEVGRDG
jgi:predicted glycogen debranching enzyme